MRLRKIFEVSMFYLLPLVLISVVIFNSNYNFYVTYGSIAEKLFILIMFAKPIAVIVKSKKMLSWMTYRKEFGVAIFWLAIFHAIGLIIKREMFLTNEYLSTSFIVGSAAMLMLLILAATSNTYSIKKLKKNWKKIQYLAYPALLATIWHVSIWERNINKFYIIGGLFVGLKIIEWNLVKKKKEPPKIN